ncbi:MAG: outer membrane beta-barrel family protein [Tannerella sp.]|jgi:hypothetical protein|nr:outer membrane beta-barrel family protein [Tannerella sp.]
MKISKIGYKPYEKVIPLETDIRLGEIRMEELTVEISEVVVKAQRIVRKVENRSVEHTTEEADFSTVNRRIQSASEMSGSSHTGRVHTGGVYDLKHNQSIGLEADYSRDLRKNRSLTDLTETADANRTDIASLYSGKNTRDNCSASANYLLPLDSLGSLFKILLDYHHNEADNGQDYHSAFCGFANYDSIYRSNIFTQNDLYAANADLSFRLNDHTTLETGLKYTRNEMNSETLFEYLTGTAWHENRPYSSRNEFTEDVAAIYASLSSRIQKIS